MEIVMSILLALAAVAGMALLTAVLIGIIFVAMGGLSDCLHYRWVEWLLQGLAIFIIFGSLVAVIAIAIYQKRYM